MLLKENLLWAYLFLKLNIIFKQLIVAFFFSYMATLRI